MSVAIPGTSQGKNLTGQGNARFSLTAEQVSFSVSGTLVTG